MAQSLTSIFTDQEKDHILLVKNWLKNKIEEEKKYCYASMNNRPHSIDLDEAFISGGIFASLLQAPFGTLTDEFNVFKDIDVYFSSLAYFDRNILISNYNNLKWIKPAPVNADGTTPDTFQHFSKMITDRSITMESGFSYISSHFGTPDKFREHFDFVHCLPYYIIKDDTLHISRQQYDCCVNKKLMVHNYNELTQHRFDKFIKLGYTMGWNQIEKNYEFKGSPAANS